MSAFEIVLIVYLMISLLLGCFAKYIYFAVSERAEFPWTSIHVYNMIQINASVATIILLICLLCLPFVLL